MTKHRRTVHPAELDSFAFEHIICSDYPRRLMAFVHPACARLEFRVYGDGGFGVDGEYQVFNTLTPALDAYNEME